MGAWGIAVFADDVALDVRGDRRDQVLDGADPEAATEALEASYAAAIEDPDDGIVFWLALALAQHETGRLLDRVRQKAVAMIDAGGDVARWRAESEALARQRAAVLNRLRTKLLGQQPAPKKLRRTREYCVPFNVGDVVLVRGTQTGEQRLFAVVRLASETTPVVEILKWRGGPIPDNDELARLPPVWLRPTGDPDPPKEGDRRVFYALTTYSPDEAFGPHIGEVIATGVTRPEIDWLNGALTPLINWPRLAHLVDRLVAARTPAKDRAPKV